MRAIILAGGPARCETWSPRSVPRPMWPLLMRPLITRLAGQLVRGGVRALSVCGDGAQALYAPHLRPNDLGLDDLRFAEDPMPRGPAGCLKDNEAFVSGETFVVVGGACAFDDPVDFLVRRHRRQGNALTVFCLAGSRRPAGVYVCEPCVLEHVPAVGYCDLKEQLIPRLVERGLRVGALPLHGAASEVLGVTSYLDLHRDVLRTRLTDEIPGCPGSYVATAPDVWVATDAQISSSTRLVGPLIIGSRAKITDGAVLIGPTSVGPDARICDHAVVSECAVWGGAVVPSHRSVHRQLVAPDDAGTMKPEANRFSRVVAVPGLESRNHVTSC